MITLQQFIDKWTGKGIDYDGHYGFQCVDLYRQYVQEVIGVPQSPGVTGAKDIWDSYLPEYYDKIANTPDGVPLPGDIMIWGTKYGQYGHVAVVVSANLSSFTCFSQNDPVGSLCGLKKYTAWGSVLGWLHPKPKDSMYRGYDLSNADSMRIAVDKLCDIIDGKYISLEDHQKIINELDLKSTEQAQTYGKEKAVLEEKIRTLEEVIEQLQDTEHTWSDTADVLQRKLAAVLAELSKVGLSLSTESDAPVLVGAISEYITSRQEESNSVLELSNALKTANDTVAKLNQTILDLKKKETAYKTFTIGKTIIKFYKKNG